MGEASLDWALAAARWALYVDLGLVFGLPFAAMLTGSRPALQPVRGLLALAALAGILLSVAGFWLNVAAMAGVAPGELDRALVLSLLTGTALGGSVAVRVVALAYCLGLSRYPGPLKFGRLIVAGGIAAATLAWAGHAAASEGPAAWARLGGDIVHLMASLSWIGALMWFAILLWRPRIARGPAPVLRALSGFAFAGSVIVALLGVTGMANLLFLVPLAQWSALPATPYGQWLAIKLGLFGAMLVLAALNRFRLVPALAEATGGTEFARAQSRLRASVSLELLAALALLGVVARFGLLDPGG